MSAVLGQFFSKRCHEDTLLIELISILCWQRHTYKKKGLALEAITIDGRCYDFCDQVRQNAAVRQSFNALTRQTFGFDFERWTQAGCWGEQYLPHLLLENGRAVANVSVNLLSMQVLGRSKQYIQLGTVMTAESHRGRGLSRFLMQRVLKQWAPQADAVYLFANDSAAGFYPKFSFVPTKEYEYSCVVNPVVPSQPVYRLDLEQKEAFSLLAVKAAQGNPYAELRLQRGEALTLFYALSFYRNSFYHLPKLGVVAAAECEPNFLLLYDVFGPSTVSLAQIIAALASEGETQVTLGFAPREKEGFSLRERNPEDETLFWLKGKENPFQTHRTMFPLLSHA